MRINIYYGGRGLIEDPTLVVLDRITKVLEELRVEVARYNMYEDKSAISTLPASLKECDGVILAASVEWHGIGGNLASFLDMCWLYADKEKLSELYMLPVVCATAFGEQEAELELRRAWEVLGGISLNGIATYVESVDMIEDNRDYLELVEKCAEDLYRSVNKRSKKLPTSNRAVAVTLGRGEGINLTPQESEQLSKFVADDGYVRKQKEDIEELSKLFKQMLGTDEKEPEKVYEDDIVEGFFTHYRPERDFKASYVIVIPDKKKHLIITIGSELSVAYGEDREADVKMKCESSLLADIQAGRMTFQKGFMSGEITAKGNFKTLRMLDQIFVFSDK